MSKLETNQVDPATGTTLTLGTSGDTISIPSGVTIANSGTATGFGAMTPTFSAYVNSDQTLSDNTDTKGNYDTESYDTDSAYDTSNKRFTVPSGEGGKYFFYARGRFYDASDQSQYVIAIRKNNSEVAKRYIYSGAVGTKIFNSINYFSYDISCTLVLSASDYIEVFVKADDTGGTSITYQGGTVHSEFTGYKLTGA